jgi:hypothetical protein
MRLYHYLTSKYALDDVRNRRLKLAELNDLNDPYEWMGVALAEQEYQEKVHYWQSEVLFKTYGMACFSRLRDSILMWSHYGDRHRGICLGFDVSEDLPYQVTYTENIAALQRGHYRETKEFFIQSITTKYRDWSYEQELRVFENRSAPVDGTLSFMRFDESLKLKEVIAGDQCKTTREEIKDALAGYSDEIEILRARRSHVAFEMIINELK